MSYIIAPNGTMFVLAVCHLPGHCTADEEREDEGLPSILMLWRADSWQGEFVQVGNVTRSKARSGSRRWIQLSGSTAGANMSVRPQPQRR